MCEYAWSLGTLLLGAFFNTMLLGVVAYQYFLYYTSKFTDSRWVRLTVHLLLGIDLVHSAIIIYVVWFYIVQNYNNPDNLAKPFWAYLITPLMESCSAALSQNFLARRLFRLNERRVTYYLLLIFILLSLTLVLSSTIGSLSHHKSWDLRPKLLYLYVSWILLQMATDLILSISLAAEFNSFRTGRMKSDQVLSLLVRKSIQTGLFATVITVGSTCSFLFARRQTGHLCGALLMLSGRVYSHAILDTLLIRTNFREVFSEPGNLTEIVVRDLEILGHQPGKTEHNVEDAQNSKAAASIV